MRLYIILLFSITFFACNSDVSSRKSGSTINPKILEPNDSMLRHCIPEKDTLFNDGNFIKYVIIDTFYTLQIQVGAIDTLLSYQFNCSVPRGLVPSLYSYYKSIICLIRGTGQHYREFLICYSDSNKIIVNKYETALAANLADNIVAYQSVDSSQNVYIENIKTGKKKSFVIPSKFSSTNISQAIIKDNKLFLHFSDERGLEFLLR